jgi:hypothetical protein
MRLKKTAAGTKPAAVFHKSTDEQLPVSTATVTAAATVESTTPTTMESATAAAMVSPAN